jgi:hypothetical protein
MSTESIINPSKTLTKHYESYGVFMTLTAGGGTLQENQQVYISGNNTVAKRTLGTQFPIGVITKGGLVGDKVTVQSNILRDSLAKAIGGALAAGAFVKPNGNVDATTGVPEYVAAAAGDYANAIVIGGAAQNAEIRILILRDVQVIPTP